MRKTEIAECKGVTVIVNTETNNTHYTNNIEMH